MRSNLLSRLPRWSILLVLLLILGAVLRCVNINAPPLDFHSTRQLRNALVARATYYELQPHADPQKLALAESFQRVVARYEPPISESIAAFGFLITGGESFAVPRVYGTIFWLLAGLALFDLARRMTSPIAGLISLAYFLVLPFAVQASRSFQPDPLMTSAFVIGVYFMYRWAEARAWKWAILTALFFGFSVLVKGVIVFPVMGVAIAAVLASQGWRFWKSAQVWVMAALMALPGFAYYVLGHPGSSTEYVFSWSFGLIKLIASPHFFADWLGFAGSLLGLTMLLLAAVGTVLAPAPGRGLLVGAMIGYVVYGLMLPFQMYTHSYYHIQLIPLVALGLAPVAEAVISQAAGAPRLMKIALAVFVLAAIGYQSWAARSALVAENFSDAPGYWKSVGDALPVNSEVIALTQDFGYDLMYWGWRKVDMWPFDTDLSNVKNAGRDPAARFAEITAGKDYFLVTAFGQLEQQPGLKKILADYPVAAQGDGYVLYDLRK